MQPSALAAQCLAHVEPETLAMCTALNPVHHLVAYGRWGKLWDVGEDFGKMWFHQGFIGMEHDGI